MPATTLESLNLAHGGKFLDLFDFGDEWRFQVRVHAVNADPPAGGYPSVVESVGQGQTSKEPGTWNTAEAANGCILDGRKQAAPASLVGMSFEAM